MFIHGKLFLTAHNIMLDEVRSLLQKSLRRKEWVLALQSSKELLGHDKDQLPWKSVVTYLFEDHCLSDTDVLMTIYKATQDKNKSAKYACIELLMQCQTCRIAACLPVIALDSPYEPKKWDPSITVDEDIRGLVVNNNGLINTDLLLAHLLEAWKSVNHELIITYMKLASMVVDHEKRQVTEKGKRYLISSQIKKPNFGQVVLSMLYRNTDDPSLRGYLAACHRLTTVPEVCIRLILFAPVARVKFSKYVSGVPEKKMGRVDWKTVRKIKYMPGWAVDKHTFRGKFGRGTKCILKKKPSGMTEEEYDEFHGEREKRGIESFFNEGVKCAKEALPDNPYWERTKEIYLGHSPKKQKTAYMTADYYKKLKHKYPKVFEKRKEVFFGRPDSNEEDETSDGGLFGPPRKTGGQCATGQSLIDNFLNPRGKPNGKSSVQPKSETQNGKRKMSSSDSDFTSDVREPAKKKRIKEDGKTESKPKERPNIFTLTKEMGCPPALPENLLDDGDSQTSLSLDDFFKIKKPSMEIAYQDEALSRAQKRRLQQSARRICQYEEEVTDRKRKLMNRGNSSDKRDSPVKDEFADLFGDNDPLPSTSSNGRGSSRRLDSIKESHSSDEDDSGFVTVDTPLGLESPFSSPIADLVANVEYSSSKSRKKKSRLHSLSPMTDDNQDDLLEGLEDEFKDDLDETGFTEEQEASEEVEGSDGEGEEEAEEEEYGMLALRGPLLQIPTSKAKTYTVADMDEDKVVKGPYKDIKKMHRAMFLHQSMRDVIGDPHTLDFEPEAPYLTFPLIKGEGATMEIITKNFTDLLSDAEIEGAEFIPRSSLGIVQLHKLPPEKMHQLPVSIWAHFLFRFALNVGDSGLFNALTDSKLSFVYGIDLEENRGEYTGPRALIDIMFTKAPKKKLCEAILVSMKLHKTDLFRLVCRQINYAQLDRLAREYEVEYSRLLFIERIKMCRQLVAKL